MGTAMKTHFAASATRPQTRTELAVGDTILPPPQGLPPDFEGFNDDELYKQRPQVHRNYFGATPDAPEWRSTCFQMHQPNVYHWVMAHIPIPGFGSVLPHLYVPMIAHLFFRSWLIAVIMVFVWALVETSLLVFLKWSKAPVRWPRSRRHLLHQQAQARTIKNTAGEETLAWTHTDDAGGQYWVDFETAFVTVALWNPVLGIAGGVFVDWYIVRALDLPPFNTHLCSSPCLDGLLIGEFVIFFLVAVKLGRNTAWLCTAIGVPVYILAVMAPINHGYTNGFSEFSPYLYWLLLNGWFALWFLRDPFGIGRLVRRHKHAKELGDRQYALAMQTGGAAAMTTLETPFYPYPLNPHTRAVVPVTDPRKNTYYWWSIDGTYGWNAFFAVVLLVIGVSIYKVIAIST